MKQSSVFNRLGPKLKDTKLKCSTVDSKQIASSCVFVSTDLCDSRGGDDVKDVVTQKDVDEVVEDVYDVAYRDNPSPINVDRLECWLKGYNPISKAEVVHMVRHGVRILSSFFHLKFRRRIHLVTSPLRSYIMIWLTS